MPMTADQWQNCWWKWKHGLRLIYCANRWDLVNCSWNSVRIGDSWVIALWKCIITADCVWNSKNVTFCDCSEILQWDCRAFDWNVLILTWLFRNKHKHWYLMAEKSDKGKWLVWRLIYGIDDWQRCCWNCENWNSALCELTFVDDCFESLDYVIKLCSNCQRLRLFVEIETVAVCWEKTRIGKISHSSLKILTSFWVFGAISVIIERK